MKIETIKSRTRRKGRKEEEKKKMDGNDNDADNVTPSSYLIVKEGRAQVGSHWNHAI